MDNFYKTIELTNNKKLDLFYESDNSFNPRHWGSYSDVRFVLKWGDYALAWETEGLAGVETGNTEQAMKVLAKLEKQGRIILKPVYGYGKGGLYLSYSKYSCPFDGGFAGFAYIFKENVKDGTEKDFKTELDLYNKYINGDVYSYRLYYEKTKLEQVGKQKSETTTTEELVEDAGFIGLKQVKDSLLDNYDFNKEDKELLSRGLL